MKKKWLKRVLASLMVLESLGGNMKLIQAEDAVVIDAEGDRNSAVIWTEINETNDGDSITLNYNGDVSPHCLVSEYEDCVVFPGFSYPISLEIRNNTDETYRFTSLSFLPDTIGIAKVHYQAFKDQGYTREQIQNMSPQEYYDLVVQYIMDGDPDNFTNLDYVNRLFDDRIDSSNYAGYFLQGALVDAIKDYVFHMTYFTFDGNNEALPLDYDTGYDNPLTLAAWANRGLEDVQGLLPEEIGPHETITLNLAYGGNARLNNASRAVLYEMGLVFGLEKVQPVINLPSLSQIKGKDVNVISGQGVMYDPYIAQIDLDEDMDKVQLGDLSVDADMAWMAEDLEMVNEINEIAIAPGVSEVISIKVENQDGAVYYRVTLSRPQTVDPDPAPTPDPTPTPSPAPTPDSPEIGNGDVIYTGALASLTPYIIVCLFALMAIIVERSIRSNQKKDQ
ncbi:MAG: hypothetical protein LBR25_10300 [Erysipelotrichaceae bacterium]|jgi:hypothetical protein|nr:hypothetical protein [Erysipelotrichaceae bacterium]